MAIRRPSKKQSSFIFQDILYLGAVAFLYTSHFVSLTIAILMGATVLIFSHK
jgi:hypothetical protein